MEIYKHIWSYKQGAFLFKDETMFSKASFTVKRRAMVSKCIKKMKISSWKWVAYFSNFQFY